MNGRQSIAVIGAGWAGCTAAMDLTEAGFAVTLFESARTLGGRARTVKIQNTLLDNGQHILLGAYTQTLSQLQKAGVDTAQALLRLPLQMRYPPNDDGMTFVTPPLPAPLHMLVGLWRASGLTREDKMALARFTTTARWMDWQLDEDCSVATLLDRFDQTERLIALMWRPLCIAALNTPIERASAQVFLNVLHDSLGARRTASDMLLPRVDLGALLPDYAARYITQYGGNISCGTTVKTLHSTQQGWSVTCSGGQTRSFDGIVVATSASAAVSLLNDLDEITLSALEFEPITTCYLQYAPDIRLPDPMYALCDDADNHRWGQFVFDRGQLHSDQHGLLAVVISTAAQAADVAQDQLAAMVARQLAQVFDRSELGAPLWTQVITEKRATFACTPALKRVKEETVYDNLVLAGDYLASPYPATLESAVRSGQQAARLLTEHFS
ncbi:hydroxysqualene dehydroxylase HpnE [uncultured Oxalicibacterium sp.]|uniref:hydroxysqualene dehydroxylase HpnE n=1 Tax=uncultured Oxalicibacterium sp. TaxID=1168540 RepID=UPI0025F08A7B|nr:hydroxysqualene dehydroxylase HpnE [uncultured Oxalicibacterium sp.]